MLDWFLNISFEAEARNFFPSSPEHHDYECREEKKGRQKYLVFLGKQPASNWKLSCMADQRPKSLLPRTRRKRAPDDRTRERFEIKSPSDWGKRRVKQFYILPKLLTTRSPEPHWMRIEPCSKWLFSDIKVQPAENRFSWNKRVCLPLQLLARHLAKMSESEDLLPTRSEKWEDGRGREDNFRGGLWRLSGKFFVRLLG